MNMSLREPRVGGWSDPGKRCVNEDYYRISPNFRIAAVADGIGGAPHGEVLSKIAVNVALSSLEKGLTINDSIEEANLAAIQTLKWLNANNEGCGSTLLVARWGFETVELAWAGDTEAFLLRGGKFTRLTESDRAMGTNALSAGIGLSERVSPHSLNIAALPKDRFVFCTDGVWSTFGKLKSQQLREVLCSMMNPPLVAVELVKMAIKLENDNATAVVLAY